VWKRIIKNNCYKLTCNLTGRETVCIICAGLSKQFMVCCLLFIYTKLHILFMGIIFIDVAVNTGIRVQNRDIII
jgi:hypothetical protein